MDLVTRKKLLLRKYNNNAFSPEQLDFFGKINATQIIVLLKQNPHLRTCSIFFEHTSIREIEKPEETFVKSEIFNILVNILRNTTMLLDICFNNADFNYMSIFGFLEEEHVDYSVLLLLEDVLLPYIRKTPSQVMEVIANDEGVQEYLLNRIYERPIFKIMYTVVFCLSKRHSDVFDYKIKRIVHELVNTPFTYLLHKEKKSQQIITIIALNKTLLKNETKFSLDDSTKNLPKIHTKKIKQKKPFRSSTSSEDIVSIEDMTQIEQIVVDPKFMSHDVIESQNSMNSNKSDKKQNHHHTTSVRSMNQLDHTDAHSMSQIQSEKQIPLNEDLDYSDLTFNMKQLFSDIAFNIKSVYLKNVLALLQNFNEPYIESLLANCKRYILNEEYEGYCEGAISILLEFGQMYKATMRFSQNINKGGPQYASYLTTEYQTFLNGLCQKLKKEIQMIASKIPYLCSYILENNQVAYTYSSGEKLKKIGVPKLKILQLILQLLQLNSKGGPQPFLNFNLQIKFEQFDTFLIAQKYLRAFKWNNVIHGVITKIVRLTLQQDYKNFKRRYIQSLQMPKDGFLGTLVELFRSKKFVFLKNMKLSNYGNVNAVYQVTKEIVAQVIKNGDYSLLIMKFPSFDTFVQKDLVSYEKNLNGSQLVNGQIQEYDNLIIKCTCPAQDMNGKPIQTSIQSAEQLIHQIQNSRRWVPSQWKPSRKSSV